MLQREEELRQVYERQLANGGIIDLEAEKNRFFISIQEVRTFSVCIIHYDL